MRRLSVFCFLWDDPLFNTTAETAKLYLEDPEFLNLRRQAILTALEMLYIRLATQRTWKDHWHEDVAREAWTWQQLLPHISPDIATRVMIDRRVNMMDPDFSFRKALSNEIWQLE